MAELPAWPVSHFAQSNPEGPGQDDVPALLRRVAETIESLGPVDVRDICFHNGFDPGGDPYLHMVVYYVRKEDTADEPA